MDYAGIALTVAQLLGPALPDLVKGAAQSLGKGIGEDIWREAKEVWNELQGAFASDETLQNIAGLARKDFPMDYVATLSTALEEHLKRNPGLAEALSERTERSEVLQRIVALSDGVVQGSKNVWEGNGSGVQKHIATNGGKIIDSENRRSGPKA